MHTAGRVYRHYLFVGGCFFRCTLYTSINKALVHHIYIFCPQYPLHKGLV